MPQARPYKVPGKRSPLGQFLHGAATTAPDVLKRMLKIQEPLSPADASLMAYRQALAEQGERRLLLEEKRYTEEPEREETKDERAARLAEEANRLEDTRKRGLVELKGESKRAKAQAKEVEAQRKESFAKFEQGLETGDYLFKRREEATERGLENIFKKVMTDKARAETKSIGLRDAIAQSQLTLDQEGFTWDKAVDRANLLWEFSKLKWDAETTMETEKYRAAVRLFADNEAAGLRVHDMTKHAMNQVGFYEYMVMTAANPKQKEAAVKEVKLANQRFASAAKEFDGITYTPGEMKFERKSFWWDTWDRGEAGAYEGPPPKTEQPRALPEYQMPALPERPVLPGQLPAETPTMGPPLSAGATILSQAQRSLTKTTPQAPQAEVDKAIKDLSRAALYPPYRPKQIERLLQDFSPAQVEEIIKALTKEIEDALTY